MVADVAVLERVRTSRSAPGPDGRERRRQRLGEPVSQEGRGLPEVPRQVGGESGAYGIGMGIAFEPGLDGRSQAPDIGLGQEQPGIIAAQAREQVGGRTVPLHIRDRRTREGPSRRYGTALGAGAPWHRRGGGVDGRN